MSVFRIISIFISIALVSCEEYVPVLVWSTPKSENPFTPVPALSRLSSNEFSDYLLKRVKRDKPIILLFVEENLSVEDFRWLDVDENELSENLGIGGVSSKHAAFLPAVHDPYRAIQRLKNHGYNWKSYKEGSFENLKNNDNTILEVKFKEPDFLKDRPDMLLEHDAKISETMKEVLKSGRNVMAVYTGHHASWIDAELSRFKREEKEVNESNTLLISDFADTVRIFATLPIVFESKLNSTLKTPNIYNITSLRGVPTFKTQTKTSLVLSAKFTVDTEVAIVDFKLTSPENEWWTFDSIELNYLNSKFELKPSVAIGGPSGYCFFCNPNVVFSSNNMSLTFENFQAQPRIGKEKAFGPVIHCIPFFSIAIWSGIVVVAILSIVLAWGIVMIMDINTNDRFDDPKGKTITISAVE